MSHFDISDPAQRDLGEIAEYLNDRNPAAARKQIAQFLDAFRKLADLPGMGRSQEHRRPNMRSWPVGSYVVYYRPTPDGIRVLRVFHGSRDLDSLL